MRHTTTPKDLEIKAPRYPILPTPVIAYFIITLGILPGVLILTFFIHQPSLVRRTIGYALAFIVYFALAIFVWGSLGVQVD